MSGKVNVDTLGAVKYQEISCYYLILVWCRSLQPLKVLCFADLFAFEWNDDEYNAIVKIYTQNKTLINVNTAPIPKMTNRASLVPHIFPSPVIRL